MRSNLHAAFIYMAIYGDAMAMRHPGSGERASALPCCLRFQYTRGRKLASEATPSYRWSPDRRVTLRVPPASKLARNRLAQLIRAAEDWRACCLCEQEGHTPVWGPVVRWSQAPAWQMAVRRLRHRSWRIAALPSAWANGMVS